MLLGEMTTLQLLIVNLPQILMAIVAILGALGIGKTVREVKKNSVDLKKNSVDLKNVQDQVEVGNDILSSNVQERLKNKDDQIGKLTEENTQLRSRLSAR